MIRALDPAHDLPLVAAFHKEAADYWLFADRRPPGPQEARDFFTDGPPGCDPAASHRLGLFVGDRLSGVAELSSGFPEPGGDACLGLMLLAPRLRVQGHGARFFAHVERLARLAGSARPFLGVLDANPRGRAFWTRQGFAPTDAVRRDTETGHVIRRMARDL